MPNGVRFVFGPLELEPGRRRLSSSGEPMAISDRQLDVLIRLVSSAGQIVAKDDLLDAAWQGVAVGDNSLEQVISSLRRLLGSHPDGTAYIETVPRRGYRFRAAVARAASRESEAGIDALLAPHRAFVEGRAALETLQAGQISGARTVFEAAVRDAPDLASAHLGLANACVMQFEMTRADAAPDHEALALAVRHARDACRLEPQSGEGWATLGFVLDRTGDRLDARAAANRAVALEPDNWRHHFRLASVSWGEARLRAAHRTLALLPNFPLAHWLAATVHVARQVLGEAERELIAGLSGYTAGPAAGTRFSAVALHWMLGLIHLARGDEERALYELEAELSLESAGQLYSRECAANTWYAIGALRLRQRRLADARGAFLCALERVTTHPMARVGLLGCEPAGPALAPAARSLLAQAAARPSSVDAAVCQAAVLALSQQHVEAAGLVEHALADAEAGVAGWVLPIEPLLGVAAHPGTWAGALGHLRQRAA